MDTIKAMLARQSIREFKPDAVSRETILKILDAATHSPSASNGQPWQIFVVGGTVLEKIRRTYSDRFRKDVPSKTEIPLTPQNQWPPAMQERVLQMRTERWKLESIDPQDKEAVRAATARNSKFFGAPVMLILCMPKVLSPASNYDMGLLSENIMLAAQNAGVGSIVALNFVSQPDVLRKELEITDDLQIVIGIALGYSNTKGIINLYHSSRRPIQEVVTFKGL